MTKGVKAVLNVTVDGSADSAVGISHFAHRTQMVFGVEIIGAGAAAEVNLSHWEELLPIRETAGTISNFAALIAAPDKLGRGRRARHGFDNRDIAPEPIIGELRVIAGARAANLDRCSDLHPMRYRNSKTQFLNLGSQLQFN